MALKDEDYVNYMVALQIRNRTKETLANLIKCLREDNEKLDELRARLDMSALELMENR